MRTSKKLLTLHRTANDRVSRIRSVLNEIEPERFRYDREARVAFVVIETLNAWTNFVRSFYLSCMFSARTTGGIRIGTVTTGIGENDAIGRAVLYWRPTARQKSDGSWRRRDEPTWHDPNLLIPVCRAEGFTNITDIEAAFSAGDRTFVDLPVFRNYFAHRNQRSEKAARNLAPRYGIPATHRPAEILLSTPLGRPQSLIDDWIDHISFTIEYLCY